MSYAPRPNSFPSCTRGAWGASMPATPTVSTWALSSSARPPPLPRARAITLGRPGAGSTTSTSRPRSSHQRATNRTISASPAPPGTSDGLTESIETSLAASSVSPASAKREDARREDAGIPRVVDPDGRDGHARRQLHDREQRVEPVEDRQGRTERDADHRQVGVRGNDAGKGRREPRPSDQHA